MTDTVKSLSNMLRNVLNERLAAEAKTFEAMFAENGVMEFPYALPSALRLEGRDAITAHLQASASKIEFLEVADVRTHETGNPEVVIIEFTGFGKSIAAGAPFEQRYVSVIEVRSGRIVRYVDYWNPIAILRTFKGQAFIESLVI